MSAARPDGESPDYGVLELAALVRRVVAARVRDPHLVDDLVQETLARVMTARPRLQDAALAPYAVVTARNLVTSSAQREAVVRRHAHRLVDERNPPRPEEEVLQREESQAVGVALARLSERERDTLVAHELEGHDTKTLAASLDSTPGAIAAQLSRTRAKLRVEYLLAEQGTEPPSSRCRPVLLALSAGDRRRQRELDTGRHLLECEFCSSLSGPLLQRQDIGAAGVGTRVLIESDVDIVRARQKGRELAGQIGFPITQLTLIATAISEIARNIVRFADHGEMVISLVEENGLSGVTIVAQDAGPGIPDVDRALQDGFSTYRGLGLGLPGARRLMDEFAISSEIGKGTTVTMTKWRQER